jgi:hypothetical protein
LEASLQELEITWERVLSVWWLIVWRGVVGALSIGFVVGFILGAIMGAAGVPLETIQSVSSIVGLVIGLVWGIVVTWMALLKQYKGFRLALVPAA